MSVKKTLIFFIVLFFGTGLAARAQDMQELEMRMTTWLEAIGSASSDRERIEASGKLTSLLLEAFQLEEAFTYAFPKLERMGTMVSPDKAFRIFNWNIPMEDGSYRYRATLLFPNGTYRSLSGVGSPTLALEERTLAASDWYGALYYQIEPVKVKNETWYTLMGWEGNNKLSTKKVLDVMWFDAEGNPHFGKPIFRSEEGVKHRRVFEFAKDAKMTLAFLPAKEAIVYDVLEPLAGAGEGNYAFYAPSTAHSGYRWQKGEWHHVEIIDMTRPKSDEGKAQFNFPQRPDMKRKRSEKNPLIGD